jgi:hypothetical protein
VQAKIPHCRQTDSENFVGGVRDTAGEDAAHGLVYSNAPPEQICFIPMNDNVPATKPVSVRPGRLAGAGRGENKRRYDNSSYAPGAADDGVKTSADSATRWLAPGLYTRAQITCHRTSKVHNARHRRASPCRVHAATGTWTNRTARARTRRRPLRSAAPTAMPLSCSRTGLLPPPRRLRRPMALRSRNSPPAQVSALPARPTRTLTRTGSQTRVLHLI